MRRGTASAGTAGRGGGDEVASLRRTASGGSKAKGATLSATSEDVDCGPGFPSALVIEAVRLWS